MYILIALVAKMSLGLHQSNTTGVNKENVIIPSKIDLSYLIVTYRIVSYRIVSYLILSYLILCLSENDKITCFLRYSSLSNSFVLFGCNKKPNLSGENSVNFDDHFRMPSLRQ